MLPESPNLHGVPVVLRRKPDRESDFEEVPLRGVRRLHAAQIAAQKLRCNPAEFLEYSAHFEKVEQSLSDPVPRYLSKRRSQRRKRHEWIW
jgi:hypothetical protein